MSTFEIQPIPAATGYSFRVTSGVERAAEDATIVQSTVVPQEQYRLNDEPVTTPGPIVEPGREVPFIGAIARGFPQAPVAPEPAETILNPEAVPVNNEQRIYTEGFYGSVDDSNKAIEKIEEKHSGAALACLEARVLTQEVMEGVAKHIDRVTIIRNEIVEDADVTAKAYDRSVGTAHTLAQTQADLEPEYRTAFNAKSAADVEYKHAKENTISKNNELLILISTKAKEINDAEMFVKDKAARLKQIHEYLFNNPRGDIEIELTPIEHLEYIVKGMDIKIDGWDAGDYTGSDLAIARVYALLKEELVPRWERQLRVLREESAKLIARKKSDCAEALEIQRQKQNAVLEEEEKFAKVAEQKRQLEIARRKALNESASLHARMEEIARRSERMVSFGQEEVIDILLHTLSQYREQLRNGGESDIDAIDIPYSPSHPIFQSVSDRPDETPRDTPLQLSSREGRVAVQGVLGALKGAFRPQFEVVVDDTNK
jgi:hypothetical protein